MNHTGTHEHYMTVWQCGFPVTDCYCGTGGHSGKKSWMKEPGSTQRCTQIRDML